MPDLATPLIAWFRDNARDLPWHRPGFGAWGVLVSEFMLQQTPVSRVILHLEASLVRWPTPAALAADAPAEAVRQWANLGYPRRALRCTALRWRSATGTRARCRATSASLSANTVLPAPSTASNTRPAR